ncbi:hypothetical protein LSAT2_031728 [Lamellibrachia satsuma]|nr:hypothetical protein LSAT2_031728 [Lamellibrachia satsuma]
MRKFPCPPAAGSASDHFSDADYKTKDYVMSMDRRLFCDKETSDIRGQSDASEATSRNQFCRIRYTDNSIRVVTHVKTRDALITATRTTITGQSAPSRPP